jgi:hypothetical protein
MAVNLEVKSKGMDFTECANAIRSESEGCPRCVAAIEYRHKMSASFFISRLRSSLQNNYPKWFFST